MRAIKAVKSQGVAGTIVVLSSLAVIVTGPLLLLQGTKPCAETEKTGATNIKNKNIGIANLIILFIILFYNFTLYKLSTCYYLSNSSPSLVLASAIASSGVKLFESTPSIILLKMSSVSLLEGSSQPRAYNAE